MPSQKIPFPFNTQADFEKKTGIKPSDLQKNIGYAITALNVIKKAYAAYHTTATLASMGNVAAMQGRLSLMQRLRFNLPANPLSSSGAVSSKAVSYGSRAFGLYTYVTIAVSIGDFTYMLAELGGADVDNVHARNWKFFSDNFNRYATPQGLVTLLIERSVETDPEQLELAVKQFQNNNFFNPLPNSSVIGCDFRENVAMSAGGAMSFAFDNLVIDLDSDGDVDAFVIRRRELAVKHGEHRPESEPGRAGLQLAGLFLGNEVA